MKSFQSNTANGLWLKIIVELESLGEAGSIPSRLGRMHELLHVGLTINEPRQRWVSSRIPAMNPAFALAEVIWILNGSNEAEIINHWNPALPKFAGHGTKYHGAYGFRLRDHFDFDQLEKAYHSLQKNGASRQVVLQIWDPRADFPDENGDPVSEDIPCNINSMLKIRDNKLEWMQINRSNDIYRGLPYNIVQFTTLQEIIAGWLGIEIGSYNHLSDSLHLYLNDVKELGYKNVAPVYENTDSIDLSFEESQIYFRNLYNKMRYIAKNDLSETELYKLCAERLNYEGLDNMFLIIAADSARRRSYYDLSEELINKCSNQIYKQLWRNWSNRQISKIQSQSFM